MSSDKEKLLRSKFLDNLDIPSQLLANPGAELPLSSRPRGSFNQHKLGDGKDVFFPSLSRAIRNGDSRIIDRALDLAPVRVGFRDMMTGTSVLHVAAGYPHAPLDKLLRHPPIKTLIDAIDNRGATPLIVAVANGNVDGVRLLLENGAKTRNHMHESGQTALHIASTLEDPSILKLLLKYNDSPYFVDWFDRYGNTALLTSTEFDTKPTEILLKAGANHLAKNRKTERNILHLAVLHQRRELTEFLVTGYPDIPFMSAKDANGASPLKLALELKDVETAMILLKSIAGEKLVADFPDSLIMAIRIGKEELFNTILERSNIQKVSSHCNDDGESALAVAASQERIEMVQKLIQKGVKPVIQNNSPCRSIVETIENLNNVHITKTLLAAYIKELDEVNDGDKEAMFEIIIRKSSIRTFIVFQQSGLFNHIDEVFINPVFLAARVRNYNALLFLLLSPACSRWDWSSCNIPQQKDLLQLYLREEIYASDIYILTGVRPENPELKSCPPQTHLFKNSKENRNIFHACALGGCLNTTIFLFEFCKIFHPNECQKLDEPDETGFTPLLLSITCKNEDVAVFFIQKGANLIKTRSNGENPLNALTKYIPDHKTLLMHVMTQCIVKEERKFKKGPKNELSFVLQLYMLCPEGAQNVTDVGFEICQLDYFKYREVLCHPLLDYFVWHLWHKVGTLMKIRFYIAALSTIMFSLYVTVKYSKKPSSKVALHDTFLWWASLWLAKLTFFFHLPIFYVHARFLRRLLLLSTVFIPLLVMMYLMFFNAYDRTSLEVGGTAILASWLSLLFHGVATPSDGVTILTIWMIFQEMCFAIPTFFIVTFAFTLYLFTLFNRFIMYNNPFHAFLFTAYHIHQGSVVVPAFLYHKQNNETDAFFANTTDQESLNMTNDTVQTLDKRTELRTMLVEGLTVLFYILIASALTNMLTTLAIRAGEEHLIAKQAKTIACKMGRIHEWEIFVNGKFHAILSKAKALWVVGLDPNIKEEFVAPVELHPIRTVGGYDMFKMKNYITKSEDLECNKEIPYLLKLLEREPF